MQCLGGKCMVSPQFPGLAAVTSRATSTSCGLAPSPRVSGRWQTHPSSLCSWSLWLCSSCSTMSLCSKCWGRTRTWTQRGQDRPNSRQTQGSSRGGKAMGRGRWPGQHSHKGGAQWGCHSHKDVVLVGTAQPRGGTARGMAQPRGWGTGRVASCSPFPLPPRSPLPPPPRAARPRSRSGRQRPLPAPARGTLWEGSDSILSRSLPAEMLELLLAGCRSLAYLKGPEWLDYCPKSCFSGGNRAWCEGFISALPEAVCRPLAFLLDQALTRPQTGSWSPRKSRTLCRGIACLGPGGDPSGRRSKP